MILKKQVITEYNSDTPLIPASTTKLLSTDASMALLGGKFRWITQLEYSGEISPEGTKRRFIHYWQWRSFHWFW
jgi:D-alanyl-D-alanine carboxypeptidase/D-alanyl-D-alanine-endopeptidase (penicillin-binding protein 4)